jgi:Cytochrome c554 and c-prime
MWGVVLASAVIALSTRAGAEGAASPDVRMPGPYSHALSHDEGARARENKACEGCHQAEAAEWRVSAHARSDVDPVYRRALAIEPLAFCRGCHAPEVAPDPPQAVSTLGVGCVTCHVTDPNSAATLAMGYRLASESHAPHAVTRSTAFYGDGGCAGCHEFDFPNRRGVKMQSTVSEHDASPMEAMTCAFCHMKGEGDGSTRRVDHRFAALLDAPTLREAVDVHVERVGETSLAVSLTTSAGHAFPTGDLFRRVVVSVEAVDDDWAVYASASRSLHRNFRWVSLGNGEHARTPTGDDRVFPGAPRQVVLDLGPSATGRALSWRVEYQRVEHPLDGQGEDRAVVADSTLLASGTLSTLAGRTRTAERHP